MGTLDAKERNKLHPKSFAVPASNPDVTDGQDHFPINDRAHAANAKARVSAFDSPPSWWSGTLKKLKELIDRKADVKMGSQDRLVQATEALGEVLEQRAAAKRQFNFMYRGGKMSPFSAMKATGRKTSFPELTHGETLDSPVSEPEWKSRRRNAATAYGRSVSEGIAKTGGSGKDRSWSSDLAAGRRAKKDSQED